MTQEEFLLDMLQYYTVNPAKRRCINKSKCTYSPKSINNTTSEGCAIGRKISPDLALELDKINAGVDSNIIFDSLPKDLQSLGNDFLFFIQSLHDHNMYWEKDSLSEYGKNYLKDEIKNYKLNVKIFNKYIN